MMVDLGKFYPDEKVEIIFERLANHIDRSFRSFICRDSLVNIKELVKESLVRKETIDEFYNQGVNFHLRGVLFVEAVALFDFLRKNFIAHLPNNIDLREAKRVERLFDSITQRFSQGYMESYTKELIDKIESFINRSNIKNYNETLFHHLENHFNYFKRFLSSTITAGTNFKNTKHTECDFGKWLYEQGKMLIEDENIYYKIKQFHKNFHNLISICHDYKKSGMYREMYFLVKEIEANSLWLSNEVGYINARLISIEFSKDFLTGLLNRRALNEIFKKHLEISELTGQPISLIITDLDHFKKINDTYGHLAGDAALQHFASIMKNNLRKSDYVFRVGGEEFLVLLPNTSLEEAAKIAENLRQKLEETPLIYENQRINLTASFGVAEFKNHSHLNELIREADEKLYVAKKKGRNRVVS